MGIRKFKFGTYRSIPCLAIRVPKPKMKQTADAERRLSRVSNDMNQKSASELAPANNKGPRMKTVEADKPSQRAGRADRYGGIT